VKEMEDFWSDAELVSVYTDEQAVEDGLLVNLTELFGFLVFRGRTVNRMTRHLFDEMKPFLIDVSKSMGAVVTDREDISPGQTRDLRKTLQTKLRYAIDTADPGSERGVHFQLPPNLWLVANGTDGWTVMLPEDY